MPMSFASFQIYNHYLTTYDNKRTSRSHIHDYNELRHIYSDIQLKNRFAPLYLADPSPQAIAYAVQLKESAEILKQTITTFGNPDKQMLFSSQKAYSNTPELVEVEYTVNKSSAPEHFHIEVKEFASPQINESSFLTSNQMVLMPPDDYSFDIITNKLHYELQFSVGDGETHEQLQRKIARLINTSNIGLRATILNSRGRTALEIISDAYGVPVQGRNHFEITDSNTSHTKGIVHYLGLNKSIHNATNATYYLDGKEHSSYTNTFPVYGNYQLTLNPQSSTREADVGLYPDMESLTYNIEGFVSCYNQFIHGVNVNNDENANVANNHHLLDEMKKLLGRHKGKIEKYGIEIQDDNALKYRRDDSLTKMPDLDDLQNFGNQVLRKLHSIALDPMEYVSRAICAYSNPSTRYINPYITSIYSGMLFNSYC